MSEIRTAKANPSGVGVCASYVNMSVNTKEKTCGKLGRPMERARERCSANEDLSRTCPSARLWELLFDAFCFKYARDARGEPQLVWPITRARPFDTVAQGSIVVVCRDELGLYQGSSAVGFQDLV